MAHASDTSGSKVVGVGKEAVRRLLCFAVMCKSAKNVLMHYTKTFCSIGFVRRSHDFYEHFIAIISFHFGF